MPSRSSQATAEALHFDEIFTFEIALLQSSYIMYNESARMRRVLWLCPEHRAEANQDLHLLNAQKMGKHEAEIEKIKNVFLAILRDIKKDIDNREQPGEAVTAAMFQTMRDALAEQKQKSLSIDDVTAMIAGQIGQLAPMDEETVDLFQQFTKKILEQSGK